MAGARPPLHERHKLLPLGAVFLLVPPIMLPTTLQDALTARLGEGELQVRVEDNHLTPVTLSLLD